MLGRTALITGASRGIGRAIADLFRSQGATVLVPNRQEMDLASTESIERYCAGLGERVDILVNNAGINPLAAAGEFSDADLAGTLQVNLIAPMVLLRALSPGMAERGYGRIVNISSIWSGVCKPRRFVYATTKSGINGMTRAAAVELAGSGVMVNAVAPGFVATELTRQNNSEDELRKITENIPAGRLAEPKEIAEVVAFLCSSRNSFIVGQTIFVDGGFTCQ
ncbi:SDR family NAD(P)-dependent oxidoreductase [Geobacter sp. AOG1]|uniref:SDR family NAD(P)-dependent oxidoreductase n=1 Tax=Geobacter sp. AOG1 TaxID=1566346 RepID=UPI001CC7E00F|nr:SDR family oxidoreductase [Geobacter sp. AOG1]GFE58141.1 oxidoreductase [Geobacter sp. AOG1]